MEIKSEVVVDDVQLPPGFRFHPTDEELITHYLSNKVRDPRFSTAAIGEADMNKIEPWDLPWRAKLGEKEWYFFCVKDKKYPSGVRTNRATAAGYWKATGKDREIFRGKSLVGMKKTLVFYKGRAPKGEKSNWVAHEYRLEGDFSLQKLPQSTRNEWVISRVFLKTCGGKKIHISEMKKNMDFEGNAIGISTMPPLIDSTKLELGPEPKPDRGHVHCFSRATVAPHKIQQDFIITDPISPSSSNPLDSSFSKPQFPPLIQNEIIGFSFYDLYSSSSEFYSFEEI